MGSEDYAASDGEWSESSSTPREGDEKLLETIRKRFDYLNQAWREIRDEAEKDERALSVQGPWTDEEIESRKSSKRPCIHLDQLGQHISALCNNVRNNPISIKVDAAGGDGANDDTAELRASRIRAIEYKSNALQAYQCAFESAASIGFGVFSIDVEYKSWDSMQREIRIRRVPNAHSVLVDFDCEEADCSDMRDAFELSSVLRDDFERQFPDATMTSFGEELVKVAPGWFTDDSIQIAKYWYREPKKRRMFFVNTKEGVQRFFSDELEGFKVRNASGGRYLMFKDGTFFPVVDERETEQPFIKMVVTNGVEILERTDWPGKWIPIVPVLGKELYVKSGNQIKRQLHSYIRMGRDPQKLFDYYASNEAETIGLSPKVPFIGYKGQFEDQYWELIHQEPRAYAEVNAVTDQVPGQVLPLPQRQVYEPPIQALELGKEAARRAIQASVASYGFTRLDDTNVKSGVALKEVQQQNDMGSYHFIDNYKIAIRHAGRIINDLLDDVEQGPMEVAVRDLEDNQETVKINQRGADGKTKQYRLTDDGQHEVTLSTGPNYQSQRQEASSFGDVLIGNLKNLPVTPQAAASILAKAIRLKNLGPIGDAMADVIDPEQQEGQQPIPPQVQQQIEQMKQAHMALNQYAKQLEAQINELKMQDEANEKDNAVKLQIATMQEETKRILKLAELETKSGIAELQERIKVLQIKLDADLAGRSQDLEEVKIEKEGETRRQELEASIGEAERDREAQKELSASKKKETKNE